MSRYEYKIEFESEFKDISDIVNKINNVLVNSELNEHITNIKPTFTILEMEDKGLILYD